MKLNWGEGGAKQKTFHGRVWIFSGTAHSHVEFCILCLNSGLLK